MALTRSPLRSALLPVLWPPTCLRPGGAAPPPAGWTPIQQMPGWEINYQIPLNPETTDTGSAWVGVNHAIVALDGSIYIANFQVNMPEAVDLPCRIVVTYADTVVDPGSLLLAATISIQDQGTPTSTSLNAPNDPPPTTDWNGAPFTFQWDAPLSGGTPAFSNYTNVLYTAPNIIDGGEGTVSMRFTLELEMSPGVWTEIGAVPGLSVFPSGPLSYAAGEFFVPATSTDAASWSMSFFIEDSSDEYPELNARLTVLEYEEVVDPDPGTKTVDGFFQMPTGNPLTQNIPGPTDYPASYPTNAFSDSPYEKLLVASSVTPAVPGTTPPIMNVSINGPAYDNADVAGVVMNYSIAIEVLVPG